MTGKRTASQKSGNLYLTFDKNLYVGLYHTGWGEGIVQKPSCQGLLCAGRTQITYCDYIILLGHIHIFKHIFLFLYI